MRYTIALFLSWLILVLGGFAAIELHANAAGQAAAPSGQWPADSALALDPTRRTLVMFAHPRCPCTRASFEELSRVMARFPEAASVTVAFTVPAAADAAWFETELFKSASRSQGVEVFVDKEGREAERFGAYTSGSILLFDAQGALLYNGGVTGSRAHEGDNAGKDTLEAVLRGEAPGAVEYPVFGCGLVRPGQKVEDPS